MSVSIEIIDGPLKGMEVELRPGMKIGRSGADLNLKDPKASSIHAEVRIRGGSENTMVLLDLGSTNGIKIGGKRVASVDLRAGVEFQIGNTLMKVTETAEAEVDPKAPKLSDWRSHLVRIASKVVPLPLPKIEVRPFDPMIELVFTAGPNRGERLVLGYGPRSLGHDSAEIKLVELTPEKLSFEFVPVSTGVVEFRTKNTDQIRFNALSKGAETIKTGDKIQFGTTVIEIKLEARQ